MWPPVIIIPEKVTQTLLAKTMPMLAMHIARIPFTKAKESMDLMVSEENHLTREPLFLELLKTVC